MISSQSLFGYHNFQFLDQKLIYNGRKNLLPLPESCGKLEIERRRDDQDMVTAIVANWLKKDTQRLEWRGKIFCSSAVLFPPSEAYVVLK